MIEIASKIVPCPSHDVTEFLTASGTEAASEGVRSREERRSAASIEVAMAGREAGLKSAL